MIKATKKILTKVYFIPHHTHHSLLVTLSQCSAKRSLFCFLCDLCKHSLLLFFYTLYHCHFYVLHKCSLLFLQYAAKRCHLCNHFLLLSAPHPSKQLFLTVLPVSIKELFLTVLSMPCTTALLVFLPLPA